MSIRPLPIVATKLAPPKLVGASVRPDTLERLRAGSQHKLMLVQAPAGYGKSTTVAHAALTLGWRFSWYKLDILDQDPLVFAASLAESVRRTVPGFGFILADRLADLRESPTSINELLGILAAELTDEVSGEHHLVLDDYHESANSAPLNSAIDYLLASLPANIHFVVLTRYEPSFQLSRLRLADDVAVIDREDLRFSPQQAAAFIAARGVAVPNAEQLEYVLDHTEGWPASLVLICNALARSRRGTDEAVLADPLLKGDLYSYLAEQAYMTQSAEVRSFLRQSSALEYMTADLAASVARTKRADRHLQHLTANCLFTFRTATGKYRYHRLFRDLLRQKAIQEDGAAAFREAQLRAAAALESAGDISAAVEAYLALSRCESAAMVLERSEQEQLDDLLPETLRSWGERLSRVKGAPEAWASLIGGHILFREADYAAAITQLRASARCFAALGNSLGQYLAWCLINRCFYWNSDYWEAARASDEAASIAPNDANRVHALTNKAAALLQDGRWAAAQAALELAEGTVVEMADTEATWLAAQRVSFLYFRGHFSGATESAEALRDRVSAHLPASFQIAFLNVLALLNVLRGLPDRAGDLIVDATEMARRFGYRLYEPHLLDTEGQRLMALGLFDAAIDHFNSARHHDALRADVASRALVISHIGTAWRRQGDLGRASTAYNEAATVAAGAKNIYAQLTCASNRSYADGLRGKPQASALLCPLREQATRAGLGFVANKCAIFQAALAFAGGGTDEDRGCAPNIIPVMLEQGQHNFLASELCRHTDLTAKICRRSPQETWLPELISCLAGYAASETALEHVAALDDDLALLVVDRIAARLPSERAQALLRHLSKGRSAAASQAARPLIRRKRSGGVMPQLTESEGRVLELMAGGLKNADIASRLCLSPATVKTHVNRIFRKLEVTDRVGAVLCYRDHIGNLPGAATQQGRPTRPVSK
jgi:ATP/maltotriose-dependent transcriptional regulator MalT